MSLLADWLAHVPNYFVFRATFRLETPWFMPDFSVTVECTRGSLEPAARPMLTGAMLDASARSVVGTRADAGPADRRPGRRRPTAAAGAADACPANATVWTGQAVPVPLDATIEIQFSPMLADRVGIGQTNPDLGRQITGDGNMSIEAVYELTAVEVRRRPRGTTRLAGGRELRRPGRSAKGPLGLGRRHPHRRRDRAEEAALQRLHAVLGGRGRSRSPTPRSSRRTRASPAASADPDVARLDFHDDRLGAYPLGFLRTLNFVRRGDAGADPRPRRRLLDPPAGPAGDGQPAGRQLHRAASPYRSRPKRTWLRSRSASPPWRAPSSSPSLPATKRARWSTESRRR